MMENQNIGIVILAAGASTRFGSPKQLAIFKGETLLERISKTAQSTGFETVIVLGANSEKIQKTLGNLKGKIVINNAWEEGMSSSINAGLKELLEIKPNLSAVILVLCDQPFITKETLLKLTRIQAESGKSIVASEYANTIGTPALFIKRVFKDLMKLTGNRGAKGVINQYKKANVATISAQKAAFDIDTREDLTKIKTK